VLNDDMISLAANVSPSKP